MTEYRERKSYRSIMRTVFWLFGVILTGIFLRNFSAPFVWMFFSWFLILIIHSLFSNRSSSRQIFFWISLIPLVLGIFEASLSLHQERAIFENYTKDVIIRNHETLGYAPLKNSQATHKKYFKNALIFDVVYTIDADGLRISPPCDSEDLSGSILFFGGSFTFGTGLNDGDTLPYQTGMKSWGKYCVYNFGFRGYGPHQMLSALEHGLVEKTAKHQPKYAIYQALTGHIGRAAGLAFWDEYGPRYVLDRHGKLKSAGHFKPGLRSILRKSAIFRKISVRKLAKMDFGKERMDLFVEIIGASRNLVERLFPGCEFHVLFWNEENRNYGRIVTKLKEKGIRLHSVNQIFRKSKRPFRESELKISPYDPHPSALANDLLSDYLVSEVIREQ